MQIEINYSQENAIVFYEQLCAQYLIQPDEKIASKLLFQNNFDYTFLNYLHKKGFFDDQEEEKTELLITTMIQKGHLPVNYQDRDGKTLLHFFVEIRPDETLACDLRIVKLLVQEQADLTIADRFKNTVLHYLGITSSEEIFTVFKLLIDKIEPQQIWDVNFNKENCLQRVFAQVGKEPLKRDELAWCQELFAYMMAKGSFIFRVNALYESCIQWVQKDAKSYGNFIQFLVDETGQKINYIDQLAPIGWLLEVLPIVMEKNAISYESHDIKKIISLWIEGTKDQENTEIEDYIKPRKIGFPPDDQQYTHLEFLCINRYVHLPLVEFLIKEYNEDPNIKNKEGENCLHLCGSFCDQKFEAIKYLIDQGVNPEEKDNDDQTILHRVCADIFSQDDKVVLDIAVYLINEQKLDPNSRAICKGLEGNCLDFAIAAHHLELVIFLANKGVKPSKEYELDMLQAAFIENPILRNKNILCQCFAEWIKKDQNTYQEFIQFLGCDTYSTPQEKYTKEKFAIRFMPDFMNNNSIPITFGGIETVFKIFLDRKKDLVFNPLDIYRSCPFNANRRAITNFIKTLKDKSSSQTVTFWTALENEVIAMVPQSSYPKEIYPKLPKENKDRAVLFLLCLRSFLRTNKNIVKIPPPILRIILTLSTITLTTALYVVKQTQLRQAENLNEPEQELPSKKRSFDNI